MHGNYFRVLNNLVQKYGISTQQLLEGTGISPSLLHGTLPLPEQQFTRVCERALRLTADPALGLRFGQAMNISTHGVLGYALMSSAKVADVLQLLLQYHRMLMPSLRLSLIEEQQFVALECSGQHVSESLERFWVESFYAAVVVSGRFLVGDGAIDVSLHLDYSEPDYGDVYAEVFGFPVFFNAAARRLMFPKPSLDLPLATANPAVRAIFREQCNSLLPAQGGQTPVAGRVQQILLLRSGDFPAAAQVAKQLFMSERTLRRRLSEEGKSFQQLLDQVRLRLACEYLRNTGLPVTEVARLVGFNDVTNFRRAFKRWSGLLPSVLRVMDPHQDDR